MIASLFDSSPKAAGFRLHRFEVLNWGTFDNIPQILDLEGNNSLLTGANGSGKTTLVDALVTLLVPRPERFYNQSAGSDDRKKQRTKEDYVIGAHGQSESDEGGKKREYLRHKSGQQATYSVILGVFINDGLKQTTTLAQLRYFQQGGMQEIFVIAPEALSIKTHFNIQPDVWRKAFRTTCPKADLYPTFKSYSSAFAKIFGLRSDAAGDPHKALTLFAQTVGIKVMGNIDQFIRQNMLDEPNIDEEFEKLRHSFHDLTTAHRSIRKARQQCDLLQPLVRYMAQYTQCETDLYQLATASKLVAPYHAHQKQMRLRDALGDAKQALESANEAVNTLDQTLVRLREEESDLKISLSTNKDAQQTEGLKRQKADAETRRNKKKQTAKEYTAAAKVLGCGLPADSAAFDQQRRTFETQKDAIPTQQNELILQIAQATNEYNGLQIVIDKLKQEITSLEQRKNNLPSHLITLRSRIATALGIQDENEIPFVGELVQVLEAERPLWGKALERLLHSFALCLLIPEKHYQAVNAYVRQTDLEGRLVYYRVKETVSLGKMVALEPGSVRSKLEIKPKTIFGGWLENEISHRFPHVCTSDETHFAQSQMALTPEGLIKQRERHEKDDRKRDHDQVLGWDNREKIRRLRKERSEKEEVRANTQSRLTGLQQQMQTLNTTNDTLLKLLQIKQFSEIDWQTEEHLINELKGKIDFFVAKNSELKAINERLTAVNQEIAVANRDRDAAIGKKTSKENEIDTLQILHQQLGSDLESYGTELPDFAPLHPYIESLARPETWQQMDVFRTKLNEKLSQQNELASSQQRRAENGIRQTLIDFRRPTQEISDQFPDWNSDIHTLPNTDEPARDAREYLAFYDRIVAEGLPEHEARFEQMLHRDIFTQMGYFRTALDSREKDIKNSIRDINSALKQIEFNPGTYLELRHSTSRAVSVRDFRESLNRWQYDSASYHEAGPEEKRLIMMETFEKISQIIRRLEEEESWKKEVTDTRNWLDFKAQECYMADGSPKPGGLYEGSGGKSGGEQAKLTYTILSAAISYQFGINTEANNSKSFRFIVIDEAFSKLDSTNARYLMELVKKLNLQVMIITPLTAVQIAEPYISSVFFVQRTNTSPAKSLAINLSITTFLEMKEKWKVGISEI